MLVRDLAWLWTHSAEICGAEGLVALVRRTRFLVKAIAVYGALRPMLRAPRTTALGKLVERRPQTVGAVIWPYQSTKWSAPVRLQRICEHYAIVENLKGCIDVS